jgi:ATP adenylyltransferase
MEYIESPKDDGCVFCELPTEEPEEALVLKQTPLSFALMNLYPYNPGHVMVAPKRHTASFDTLDAEEMASIDGLLQEVVRVLKEAMNPEGFNIGMNLGRVAGAGIADHLHWHVVPRWNGDNNFMPILGQTRVLPEMIRDTYRKLVTGFQ